MSSSADEEDRARAPQLLRGACAALNEVGAPTRQGATIPEWKSDIVQLIKGFGGKVCEVVIWYTFSLGKNVDFGGGRRGRYVDGPLGFQWWPDKCVGWIVGVIEG